MPAVVNLMKEEATLVTLVKPQFEARRSQVNYHLSHFLLKKKIERLVCTSLSLYDLYFLKIRLKHGNN